MPHTVVHPDYGYGEANSGSVVAQAGCHNRSVLVFWIVLVALFSVLNEFYD